MSKPKVPRDNVLSPELRSFLEELASSVNDGWIAYTPTITAGSGTFTSVTGSGRYKKIGRMVHLDVTVTITTNGTAASYILATLPVTDSGNFSVGGGITATTSLAMTALIFTNKMLILQYDGTYPGADGVTIYSSITYESQS